MSAVAGAAGAAEWSWEGAVRARAESLSNPLLRVPAASASRISLGADLGLRAEAPAWDLALSGNLTENRSSEPSLERASGGFGLQGSRRFERDTFTLSASFNRDTLLSGAATAGAAGSRDATSANAGWQRTLSPRWSANASATRSGIVYAEKRPGVSDNSTLATSGGLAWQAGPRTTLRAGFTLSTVDTRPTTTTSSTRGAQLSVEHALAEEWNASMSLGPTRTRSRVLGSSQVCPVEPVFCQSGLVPFQVFATSTERVSSGIQYSAATTMRLGPETTAALSTNRSTAAGLTGASQQSTGYTASVSHRPGERLTLSALASQLRARTLLDAGAQETRTLSAGVSAGYQVDAHLRLEAGWEWRRSELPGGLRPSATAFHVGLRQALERRVLR